MPRVIPFSRQAETGELHQIALLRASNKLGIIIGLIEGIRIRARRIERRSPPIAHDILESSDEITQLVNEVLLDLKKALEHGEAFLQLREDMVQELKRDGTGK